MRGRFPLTFLMLASLLSAAPSRAGSLVSATLTIELAGFAPVVFVGSGVSGSSSGPLFATLAPGSGFAGTLHFPSPTSAAPPISGWDVTVGANGAGTFSGATPSLVGGAMPVAVHICGEAYGLCLIDLLPPFGVSQTVIPPMVSGIGVTMHGAPWTAGTASIPLTVGGATTRIGSNDLNAKGAGTLVMVSSVNVNLFSNGPIQIPAFATLTLQFVPEPTGVILLGLASVALALGVPRRS